MSVEAKAPYGPHVEPDADDIRRRRHHRRRYLAGWGMLAALLLLIGALWVVNDLDIRINWPNPAPITYPTPLGQDQLNPKASIGGTWYFDPGIGTVLLPGPAQPLHARLTPNLFSLEGFVPLEILLIIGIILLAIGLGRWRHWRREYPLPLRVAGALLAIAIGFVILFRGSSASAAIDVLPG